MSKVTYSDQAITQYLLGSLPAAEAEVLDELSVTDDEFADALRTSEKDLVDAYVQGELTGAELEQFKSYYMASPLRREKVQFAQALQVFAEKRMGVQIREVQAGKAAESATKRKGTRWFSALSVFTTPRVAWQWGTAMAALVLLIASSWLVFENVRLRQQMSQTEARRDSLTQREEGLQKELEGQRMSKATAEQELARVREERERLEQELKKVQEQQRAIKQQRAAGQQQPSSPGEVSIASFVLAPQMRGVGQIQTISVPAQTAYVAMQLQLEPGDYPAYRVALLDQSNNQTLWRSRLLKARAAGEGLSLGVSFSAGLLKPRVVYVLRVTGISASGASEIVGDYPFRVVE